MSSLRQTLVTVAATICLVACQDAPTAPIQAEVFPAAYSLTADPTLVTFNSASCTMTSSATGITNCSWNIANPSETVLNLFAQALLDVSYDCVNTKNGRVQSSETMQLRTYKTYNGVSSASLTGTNEALPWLTLPTDYTAKFKKQNACNGNQVPQNAVWSLNYWDVSVITTSGTQRMSCFASDNRNGCFTL